MSGCRRDNRLDRGGRQLHSKTTETMNKTKPIIVTTEHKGVFFGHGEVSDQKTIRLERAQMAVYWSADVKGILGLAATGPTAGCKIGPPVPAITLQAVTSIIECSEQAARAWGEAPWR